MSALEIIRVFSQNSVHKVACDIYKKTKSVDIAIKRIYHMYFGNSDQKFEEKLLESVLI